MSSWLTNLTEFGDLAVLLPLAVATLIWLMVARLKASAVWWGIAVAFCAGATGLLKILFYRCPPLPSLHSPSGHTSFSTLIYGGMALVVTTGLGIRLRTAIVAGAGGFVLLIATSRLLLNAHSLSEVVLGLVIGLVALALFARGYKRQASATPSPLSLVLVGVGVLLMLHGYELHTQRLLDAISAYLGVPCR